MRGIRAHLMEGLAIFLLTALVVIVLVSVAFVTSFSRCLSSWANNWTTRSTELQTASDARTAALDELVRSVADIRTDPSEFEHDLTAYITASNEYTVQLQLHPIPPPPMDTC